MCNSIYTAHVEGLSLILWEKAGVNTLIQSLQEGNFTLYLKTLSKHKYTGTLQKDLNALSIFRRKVEFRVAND